MPASNVSCRPKAERERQEKSCSFPCTTDELQAGFCKSTAARFHTGVPLAAPRGASPPLAHHLHLQQLLPLHQLRSLEKLSNVAAKLDFCVTKTLKKMMTSMSPASPANSQILHRLYLLYIRQQPRIPRLYWRALRLPRHIQRRNHWHLLWHLRPPPPQRAPPAPPRAVGIATDPDRINCRKCYVFRWYSQCYMCNSKESRKQPV